MIQSVRILNFTTSLSKVKLISLKSSDDFIGRSSWSLKEIKQMAPIDGIFRLMNFEQGKHRSCQLGCNDFLGSKMNHLVQHSTERQAELDKQLNHSKHDDSKLENYQLQHVIGRGNFGIVFVAKEAKSGEFVALKCVSKAIIKDYVDVEAISAEKSSLVKLKESPFIVDILSTFNTTNYLTFVTNFNSGGDLNHLMLSR